MAKDNPTPAAVTVPARSQGYVQTVNDPERLEVCLQLLEQAFKLSAPMRIAAGHAGVHERTVRMWLEKGRKADAKEPYKSIYERVTNARSKGGIGLLVHMNKAAALDWRAAESLLERNHGMVKTTHIQATAVSVGVDLSKLSDAQFAALAGRLDVLPDFDEMPADELEADARAQLVIDIKAE